jgi:hypothetical protein
VNSSTGKTQKSLPIQQSISYTINALETAQKMGVEELQNSASTPLVKTRQMVSFQKAISSVASIARSRMKE